jgi:hypothetical protein
LTAAIVSARMMFRIPASIKATATVAASKTSRAMYKGNPFLSYLPYVETYAGFIVIDPGSPTLPSISI